MIRRAATSDEPTWPPILGLYNSVVVTLTYLRRNRVQAVCVSRYWLTGWSRSWISAGGWVASMAVNGSRIL